MKASWLSDEPRSLNRVNCGGLLRRANPCSQSTTMVHVSNRSARGQHHSSSTTNTGNVSGDAGSADVCQGPTFTVLSHPLSWPLAVHLVEASDVSPNKSRL